MGWLRKWWLLVVIVAIALVIGWEEERCQAQAYQCRASYAAQAQSERRSGNIPINQQASEQQATTAACEPNGYFCRLFSAANLPTVLLVFIGIGAVWAALRTLKAIEMQANAQINSERAWVAAELIPMAVKFTTVGWCRRVGSGWAAMSAEEVMRGEHLRHKLKFTNMGRTPAHVLRYHIGYSREVEAAGTDLRMIDTAKHPEVVFDRLLGGNESVEVEEVDVSRYIRDSIREIDDSEAAGILSGWVEYQHVFSDTDVVKVPFLYLYVPSAQQLRRIPLRKPEKRKRNK